MNARQYRTYTEEFKLEALELLKTSGKSAAQIERDRGITKGLLLKWRDRYQVKKQANGTVELAPSDLEAAQAEVGGCGDNWPSPNRNETSLKKR